MFRERVKALHLSLIMDLWLILSVLGFSYCQSEPSTEIKALLDFKAANAANSTYVQGWMARGDNCNPRPWKGLRCWSTGRVKWLRLPNANLSGNISSALDALRVLTRLDLRDNRMVGQIPADFRTLVLLKRLLLSRNKLQGAIPKSIGNLTVLEELALADNNLTGNIPDDFFAKFTRLWVVDMSNNHLTGPISNRLTNLASMKVVLLGGNSFGGPVPSSLASSTSLQAVDLSRNALTGVLPLNWTSLNLTYLNLSMNRLTGQVPLSLLTLPSLMNLSLASNNLTGDIPVTASCRFGSLAFAGNPNLIIKPCRDQSIVVVPSPSPAPVQVPPAPELESGEPPLVKQITPSDSTISGGLNPGPSPLPAVRSDNNRHPKSRFLLILVLVAGNIGMILLAAVLIFIMYAYCKKRGESDSGKNTSDLYNLSITTEQHRYPTYRYSSTSRSARTSSARTSDCRASQFSESSTSEYEKSAVFQSGVFRNDQTDLCIFLYDHPKSRSK